VRTDLITCDMAPSAAGSGRASEAALAAEGMDHDAAAALIYVG
jgi:hypothetical protein